MSIDFKILNQLKNGRTANGMVGARVASTGDNPKNKAWVIVKMNKGADCTKRIVTYYFINYEVEYLEFDATYDEALNHDWDFYLIKTEKYYNIEEEAELEALLHKWLKDVNVLQPVHHIGLPNR